MKQRSLIQIIIIANLIILHLLLAACGTQFGLAPTPTQTDLPPSTPTLAISGSTQTLTSIPKPTEQPDLPNYSQYVVFYGGGKIPAVDLDVSDFTSHSSNIQNEALRNVYINLQSNFPEDLGNRVYFQKNGVAVIINQETGLYALSSTVWSDSGNSNTVITTLGNFSRLTIRTDPNDYIIEMPDPTTANSDYINDSLEINQKLAYLNKELQNKRAIDPEKIDVSALPPVNATTIVAIPSEDPIIRASLQPGLVDNVFQLANPYDRYSFVEASENTYFIVVTTKSVLDNAIPGLPVTFEVYDGLIPYPHFPYLIEFGDNLSELSVKGERIYSDKEITSMAWDKGGFSARVPFWKGSLKDTFFEPFFANTYLDNPKHKPSEGEDLMKLAQVYRVNLADFVSP